MEKKETSIFIDGRTVLVVDDDEKMLMSLKRILTDEPYNTIFAKSGQEALEIINNQDVHLLITDMCMPGMSGLELLKIVKQRKPHIIRVAFSGYAEIEVMLAAINNGEIYRFISKPWTSNEELKTIVLQSLEYYELIGERELLLEFFETWINDIKADSSDIRFLRELVTTRRQHLYDWSKKRKEMTAKVNP